ncbi:MAG: M50 family metallopeptidase [Myxococcales bacterium]|nr:M50 family metallopeptidase [Myxococcales bacterium]
MSLAARPARVIAVVVAGLYLVPYAGYLLYPVLVLATVIHELGHALAVVVTGGAVATIALAPDGGAVTVHGGGSPAVIAAAGPLAPAVVGAVLLAASGWPRADRIALMVVAATIAAGAAGWIRGGFALPAALIGAAGLALLAVAPRAVARPATLVVALGVGLAWLARREELFGATAATPHGRLPSDVQALAAAAGGTTSTWAWGLVVGSLAALALGAVVRARGPAARVSSSSAPR